MAGSVKIEYDDGWMVYMYDAEGTLVDQYEADEAFVNREALVRFMEKRCENPN